MSFPVVQDADTKNGVVTSNSTSWTMTYPTNLASGDLILALVAVDGTAAGASGLTWPSGWVQGYIASSGNSLVWAKKLAAGTESGNFTVTMPASEQGGWRIFRITGWHGTLGTTFFNLATASDVVALYATGASASPDPPSLDPANWAAEDTLWFAAAAADTSRTFSAFPTNYTNTWSDVSGGANGGSLGGGRRQLNATSENPGTFTISASDNWAAATIAVRPTSGTTYTSNPAGALSFAGDEARQTNKGPAGAVSFAGSPAKLTSKSPAGVLSFLGQPTKTTQRGLGGGLSFAGALATGMRFSQAVVGALSFLGSIVRQTGKATGGALGFSGSPTKLTSRAEQATLAFGGGLAKTAQVAFPGSLSFSGAETSVPLFSRAVAGLLSFAGAEAQTTTFHSTPSGSVSFAGAIGKTIMKALAGGLGFVGAPVKLTARALAGAISFAGNMTFQKALAGVLSFLGEWSGLYIPGGPPPVTEPAGKLILFHWINLMRTITVILLAMLLS